MNDAAVTIVVPCYNASQYIRKCVTSILNQSFGNFELIIVDDGSTDDSLQILNELKSEDERIIVVSKKNGGASSARNLGMMMAKSDWITFVDIDDYVEKNYLSNFFETPLDETTLKIQGCTIVYTHNGDKLLCPFHAGIFDLSEGVIVGRLLHNGYSVGKLYNKGVIMDNKLEFDISISYKEDLLFLLNYLKFCNRIEFIKNVDYMYCRRPGSLSNTVHKPHDLINLNNEIRNVFSNLFVTDNFRLKEYISGYDVFCIAETIDSLYKNHITGNERRKILRDLRKLGGSNVYPIKYKTDSLFKIFWQLRLFVLLDNGQQLMRKLRD